ncbi:MAG: cytochrome b/b6 domain-containing protein [Nitrospinae bacterium]|nr:cytochrome b/b6 domain-containing protein [Nitrospinota bacterium]
MENVERVKVWDPVVRLFHWIVLLAFATAALTGFDLLKLHVFAGYAIGALIVIRVIWGFTANGNARFDSFVRHPEVVIEYLRDMARLRHKRYLGHNPAAGMMIVTLLVCLCMTVLTGLLAYGAKEIAGPFADLLVDVGWRWGGTLEDTHHAFAALTLILGGLHVAGATVESFLHRENLVVSMITGYKRKVD